MRIRVFVVLSLAAVLAMASGRNAAAQSGAAVHRFALVIGNAQYPDSDAPLKNAVSDARALAKQLRRDGFDVDVGENLKKNAMRSALDRLYGKIKSGSVVLVFFSGYGIQSDRQSYIIPVDAQIWTEADTRRDGFSVDAMLNEMNIRGAKVKVAILDASRRNPYERRFRSVAAGLAPVIAPRNTLVMYSAAPGIVINGAAANRGLFVAQLIKGLRERGKTAEEVATQTRQNVSRISRYEQIPWFSSSLADAFYFRAQKQPKSSPPVTRVEPPKSKPKPGAGPVVDPQAEARRDYLDAKSIGTRKAWNDFLDKHPTGFYAKLAKDRLAKLETPPPPQPKNGKVKKARPARHKAAPAAADTELGDLDRRLRNKPSDVDARYKRGMLYARKGDFARAIADLNKVIAANPSHARALNDRCWAQAMLDELQTALKDCNEALRIRPRFAEALDSRGFVKLKIGLPRNAIVDYDASLRINPGLASSLYGRGIAKLRSGNISGGNSDIAEAKAIDPHIAKEFASYGIR